MSYLDKVVYQIYPKSFLDTTGNGIGDIQGIITKLDYLEELGIDYIWLSPICASPQKDNGYDISDYYRIDELFGTNEDYILLIKEAKKRNIKVMMDLVLNHVSTEHIWFKKALEGEEYYRDFFVLRDKPNEMISAFKKSAWTYNESLKKYYLHLFDETQADLNWDNKNVRDELYKMINYWIKQGVEGFRLDVIDLIGKEPDQMIKSKGPKYLEYLYELVNLTFKDKILTVGECWNSSIDELKDMCGERGLTQAFHFKHLLTTKGKNKWDHNKLDISKLGQVIYEFQNKYDGVEALVMNNHDMPRLNSFWLNDGVYVTESSKLLILLFGILKGTLYIYQGEEIGMTNAHFKDISQYRDIETLNYYEINDDMEIISRISRDNARVPMQWLGSKNAGFTQGKPWIDVNSNYKSINVQDQLADNNSVLNFYKEVILFRKYNQDLINCKIEVEVDNELLIVRKESGLLGLYNFSDKEIDYLYEGEILFNNYKDIEKAKVLPYQAILLKERNV